MTGALEVLGIAILIYFALLNGLYLIFTAVASRSLGAHLRRRRYSADEEAFASPLTPGVSILLPAYNEEAGIVQSVRSLLRLRYSKVEIVVVSDGSTDRTIEVLTEAFDLAPVRLALRERIPTKAVRATYASRRHPNIVVIDKENGGKADALNAAANAASFEFVCAVDADAMLEEDALLRVAQPILDDPELVAATGGIVRIANGCVVEEGQVVEVRLPRSRIATFQVVEYFRAFLVGRVGWSAAGSLLIISGAFGLFRRDVVEAVGGWWTETVGEDMELVVRIHRYMHERDEPYRIEFVPDPVCWTECPETAAQLSRQRRRWQRGLFEALGRHRRMAFNPRYGSVGLIGYPYFLLFELLGPVIELTGYVLIPVAVWLGALSVTFLVAFLLLAVALGVLLSVAALMLEEFSFRRHSLHRDALKLVVYAIAENFGYRQVVTFWRAKAFVDILRKERTWGVMERKGLGAGGRA